MLLKKRRVKGKGKKPGEGSEEKGDN